MSAAEAKKEKPKDKPAKDKPKKKDAAPAETVAAAPAAPAAPAPPRAPADPRLKVWKKFQGRFLPKGPLRERLKEITTRWNANEEHDNVTVDELKSLHNDWKASQEKGRKTAKV
ncbi:MAG: hypothetical protein JWN86_1137 [Planctomycetota bacterium]|nr:hypothetical protein [Planctomycetota bacterium]